MNEINNLLEQARKRREALDKNRQGVALFLHDSEKRVAKLAGDKSGSSMFYGARKGKTRIAESLGDASMSKRHFTRNGES